MKKKITKVLRAEAQRRATVKGDDILRQERKLWSRFRIGRKLVATYWNTRVWVKGSAKWHYKRLKREVKAMNYVERGKFLKSLLEVRDD